MSKVRVDEFGPWIQIGPASGARPVAPTRWALGEEVAWVAVEGSTLLKVMNVDGEEAWLTAPPSQEVQAAAGAGDPGMAGWLEAWQWHQRDVAIFLRAFPDYEACAPRLDVESLRGFRDRCRAVLKSTMNGASLLSILPELDREGALASGRVAAAFEAGRLAGHLAKQEERARPAAVRKSRI